MRSIQCTVAMATLPKVNTKLNPLYSSGIFLTGQKCMFSGGTCQRSMKHPEVTALYFKEQVLPVIQKYH